MRYWDRVFDEVMRGGEGGNTFSFTNIQLYKQALKAKALKQANAAKKKKFTKRKYYLGQKFPDVYLTEMELVTLAYVFNGSSTSQTAKALSLSRRTVEYYIKNMKTKMACRYTTELITKLLKSDVIERIKAKVKEISER